MTFPAADAGNVHVVRADLATGSVRDVVGGERQVQRMSAVAAADAIAFVATDLLVPGDISLCRWDGSDERRLTRVNEPLLSDLSWPRVERRTFHGSNGEPLDGWLVRRPTAADGALLLPNM